MRPEAAPDRRDAARQRRSSGTESHSTGDGQGTALDRSWPPDDPRRTLRADCANCAALCCVAPAFAASADFAIDKPAGRPCPKLRTDFRCGIHDSLRERGFPGCEVFDCFGAGQQTTQTTFGGSDWRTSPEVAPSMFDVFTVMRQLHEVLWYLAEARALLPPGALRDEVVKMQGSVEQVQAADPTEVAEFDAEGLRRHVGDLLARVSDAVRASLGTKRADRRGADLVGADLRRADLRGSSLRGAYLLGADLRGADLRHADLLGADFRGADLSGAHLSSSIFLTQPQLQAAKGDATTTIPPLLTRPTYWTSHSAQHRPRRHAGR